MLLETLLSEAFSSQESLLRDVASVATPPNANITLSIPNPGGTPLPNALSGTPLPNALSGTPLPNALSGTPLPNV